MTEPKKRGGKRPSNLKNTNAIDNPGTTKSVTVRLRVDQIAFMKQVVAESSKPLSNSVLARKAFDLLIQKYQASNSKPTN